nr:DNA polymerase I [Gammaproteobacteria bacterium]
AELGPAPAQAARAAAVLRTAEAIGAWCAAARAADSLVVDFWSLEGRPLALALGAADAAAIIPLEEPLAGPFAPLAGPVRALLEEGPPKIVHDGKYLQRLLALPALAPVEDDLMLAAYVLDSGAADYTLPALALKYLGERLTDMEELCGRGRNQIPFSGVADDTLAGIAAARVRACRALREVFGERLRGEDGLRFVYREIELPLSPVLARLEAHGVAIDRAMLARQGEVLKERMAAIEAQAWTLAGGPFNLNSPSQIQQILFTDLKLPVKRRTPKGQPSTAEEVLAELALDYPLPQRILDYRALGKLKSTYVDKLPHMCDPRTGRIHTTYHQAVAATGRLSSSDPNLQNIPIRTEEGRRVRHAFIAGPGFSLLAADYSQIELRLMAHLSGDAGLVRAFQEGRDVHRATAAEVFGVPLAEVTDDQRRAAKTINFGLMYGMSAFGLARQLKLSQSDAQAYCDLYFARYPGVRAYMEAMRRAAREQGYVETLFGRRLYVPDIKASNTARRQYAERTAINAPLQGTAADLIKRAMLKIDAFITSNALKSRMIMQVHDELVFEVWPPEGAVLQAAVVDHMTHAAALAVPLIVDCGTGANWDDAH